MKKFLFSMAAAAGLWLAVITPSSAQVLFSYSALTTITGGATTGGSTILAGDPNPATGPMNNALFPGTDIRAGFFRVTSTTMTGSDHINATFDNMLTITDMDSGLSHVFVSHGRVQVDVNATQANNTLVDSVTFDPPDPFMIGTHLYFVNFMRFDSIGAPGSPSASYSYHVNALDTGVPEPGSIAMVAGLGVAGGLFALRLRRRRK